VGIIDLLHTHSCNDKVERWKLIHTKLLGDERINPRPIDEPSTLLGLAAAADAADNRPTFRRRRSKRIEKWLLA
jgi:hypothetical protein